MVLTDCSGFLLPYSDSEFIGYHLLCLHDLFRANALSKGDMR
jgi:hypothetical protein